MQDTTNHNQEPKAPTTKSETKDKVKPKGALANALMRTFKSDAAASGAPMQPPINPASTSTAPDPQGSAKPESTTQPTEEQSKPSKPHSILHTYKGDVQNLVKRRQLSLTRMAAAESDKKNGAMQDMQGKVAHARPNKLLVILLVTVFLIIIVLAGVYYFRMASTQTIERVPQHTPIIFVEGAKAVDTSNKTARVLKQELAEMRMGGYYSLGSVVELVPTVTNINPDTDTKQTTALLAGEFLRALDTTLPSGFISIFDDSFMLGLYASERNVPFIILKTDLYEYAFDGMLNWEDNMEQDLAPLFSPGGVYAEPVAFKTKSAFKDVVVNNFDLRILRDSDNKARMLYSFVDKNTLVITTDIQVFVELAERLRIAQ